MPRRAARPVLVSLVASAATLVAACGLHTTGYGVGGEGVATTSAHPSEGGGGGGSGGSAASSSSSTSASSSSTSSSTSASSSSSSSSGAMPVCGNSMIETGEECDDGNHAQGDGCDATCKAEHPESCPGTRIDLSAGSSVVIQGNTNSASDKFSGPSGVGACGNLNYTGSDLIYVVVPGGDGTLKASLQASYANPYVHIRTSCPGTKADEIACEYTFGPGTSTANVPVKGGVAYYVAADSWKNQAGDFTLTLALQ
jgi:cysteine-rich repeat protein